MYQLAERSAGRAAYQAQRWSEARHHYTRALSIVEFVRGSTAAEQREVEVNKVAVLLNLAAVELAAQVCVWSPVCKDFVQGICC
jgi:hypothetical protein